MGNETLETYTHLPASGGFRWLPPVRRRAACPPWHHRWLPSTREEYAITGVGDPFMHMAQLKPCA